MSPNHPIASEPIPPAGRPYDVIVWGASGYTGRLAAEHLVRAHGSGTGPDAPRWALAGRDRRKLLRVRERLGNLDPGAAALPLLTADSHDPDSLDALCRQTRTLCATVGPFALHGAPLVAACLRQRTHYCDITGEASFIRACIDAHHTAARDAGVRLVHCCGIDSVPSDLGVLLLHDHVRRNHLGTLGEVRCFVTRWKGGFSGGTFASMLNLWQAAARDRKLRRVLADPYGLNDAGERQGPDRGERPGAFYDRDSGQWASLFLMAPINTRIVRRSHQVQGRVYGPDFRYGEHRGHGSGLRGYLRAQRETATQAGFFLGASSPPTRWLLKRLLPSPGQGPSRAERAVGRFRFEHYARTAPAAGAAATRLHAVVGAACDGYEATGIFAAEAALLLSRPPTGLPDASGVLTPASALGMPLVERLRAQGIELSVRERGPA